MNRRNNQWEILQFSDAPHASDPISFIPANLQERPTPRLRRAVGNGGFEPFQAEFTTLQPGQVAEIQWKREAGHARYSWWWARVRSVRGPDSLVLEFPQYGGQAGRTLSHLATIARLSETNGLHGGVGGGLRIPTAAERTQWGQV